MCRKAWTGEPFDHDGPGRRHEGLTVRPVPPGPPEIWLGGWVDAAIERAAEHRRRLHLAGRRARTTPAGGSKCSTRRPPGLGREPLPIATASVAVARPRRRAVAGRRRGVRHLYANYERWYSSSSDGGGGRAVGEMIAGLAGFPTGEAPPGVVTGSAQQVVDTLAPLAEIGRQRTYRMALRLHYPGMDRAEVFDHLAAFAERRRAGRASGGELGRSSSDRWRTSGSWASG